MKRIVLPAAVVVALATGYLVGRGSRGGERALSDEVATLRQYVAGMATALGEVRAHLAAIQRAGRDRQLRQEAAEAANAGAIEELGAAIADLNAKKPKRVRADVKVNGNGRKAVVRQGPEPISTDNASSAAEKGEDRGRKCPAEKITVGGRDILEILDMLNARRDAGATDKQLVSYSRHFDRSDSDRDGKHSEKEYIEDGSFMTPQARRGIFGAADNNADGVVTRVEYVLNRVITDEAKGIVQRTDADRNGRIVRAEFVSGSPLDKHLAAAVFDALDTSGDGTTTIPEYLRVWGGWARPDYKAQEAALAARLEKLRTGN